MNSKLFLTLALLYASAMITLVGQVAQEQILEAVGQVGQDQEFQDDLQEYRRLRQEWQRIKHLGISAHPEAEEAKKKALEFFHERLAPKLPESIVHE